MSAVLPVPVTPAAARLARVRDLHPGWFGAVMGTGILAVAAYRNPGNLPALRPAAQVLGVLLAGLAALLAAALLGPYLIRWVRYRDAALADLRHPVFGPLYGTLPGGLLVLAIAVWSVGPQVLPAAAVTALAGALTALGALLAFAVAVAFGVVLFTGDTPVAQVNGGWFIPPVVSIIVPTAIVPLLTHVSPATGRLLLAVGYGSFGMGLLLFLFVMGLLVHRLVAYPLPPAPLAPSLWIGLGPVGVGAVAVTGLASATTGPGADSVRAVARLVGTGLWGFGLWWLAIVLVLLRRYLRARRLPYGLGWWAFTFPLGAYTVATLSLARQWQAPALEAFGVVLFAALAAAWVTVAARTAGAARAATIWRR